jgi:salicylate hydroxylase
LQVAIIGGGAGGLAAANFLTRRGMRVSVFEQASKLGEVGAGVMIAPNGLRMLDRIGLGDGIREYGARIASGSSYHRKDGQFIAPALTTDSSGDLSLHGMHRVDLLNILAAGLPAGVIHTGHKAVNVDQDAESARVHFANRAIVEADAIIGADGIHSVLRRQFVDTSPPVHSGSLAYRGLLDANLLPNWPRDRSQIWMGNAKHFIVFPVRRGELLNYVGFVPTDDALEESWSAAGDPEKLRASFAGWEPCIEELLSKVESCFWWGLYDREPLSRWGSGRVTLLGDAAHPMLPHMGQGVNQAIDDAAALAVHLGSATQDSVPQALEAYATQRRARTRAVQSGSRQTGKQYDSHYADLSQRDAEVTNSRDFRLRLYDYDAEAEAQKALAHVN